MALTLENSFGVLLFFVFEKKNYYLYIGRRKDVKAIEIDLIQD